jgi:hypothetical protein
VRAGDDGAVYVANILERSEAFRRGLRVGDEIVSFAGRPIRSVNQFKNILGIYPKGWSVPLVYRREGQKHEIVVRLRGLHRQAELAPHGGGPQQPPEGPRPEERRPEPGPDGPPPRRGGPEEQPHPLRRERPAPPAEYSHLFVEKPGFANWYFNLQERQRVMAALRSWGDFRSRGGNWELTGRTVEGSTVNFKLSDQAAAAILGDLPAVQLADQPWTDQPPGSGGLLAALFHLRLLLLDPEGRFTEFYYLGSEPLDGGKEMVDVVIATKGTVTSRWYFHREDGRLAGWDTAIEEDADECRVRIESVREFDGVRLPERFTVDHAGARFGTFVLEGATLPPPGE